MEKTNQTAFFFCLSFLSFCDLTVCFLVGTNSHLTIRAKTVLSAKLYFFFALRTQSKRNMKQTDCNFLHICSVTLGRKTSYLFFSFFLFWCSICSTCNLCSQIFIENGKRNYSAKILAGWLDGFTGCEKQTNNLTCAIASFVLPTLYDRDFLLLTVKHGMVSFCNKILLMQEKVSHSEF